MLSIPFIIGTFVAGVMMFLAPCTLPIVPGYLAFIAGVPESGIATKAGRRAVIINALAFVTGFSIVFIFFGTMAGLLGFVAGEWRVWLARAGGLLIILFGLTLLGVFDRWWFAAERRIKFPALLRLGHPSSSALIGAVFALGWSPCIGPILGTVLLLASSSTSVGTGALLLTIFSLGMALPFLLTAMLLSEVGPFFAKIAHIAAVFSKFGGVFLVFLGALMLVGDTGLLLSWGEQLLGPKLYASLLQYM
ncbi:MAG: cytochrome c biogenesis protein CcdA [Patescibacteria group bacterium]|nr:cytochrome c biogenesis protein CcdA [Patescibacteria group bacterium]